MESVILFDNKHGSKQWMIKVDRGVGLKSAAAPGKAYFYGDNDADLLVCSFQARARLLSPGWPQNKVISIKSSLCVLQYLHLKQTRLTAYWSAWLAHRTEAA